MSKNVLKLLLALMLTASFLLPAAAFAAEPATFSIFDVEIPFVNVVDCQYNTAVGIDGQQLVRNFKYPCTSYGSSSTGRINGQVPDVVDNPQDYYYRLREGENSTLVLTLYNRKDPSFSYVLFSNGKITQYGDNCFLYNGNGYGSFISFREKDYHFCATHTYSEHAKTYYPDLTLTAYGNQCVFCGCGEFFIIEEKGLPSPMRN